MKFKITEVKDAIEGVEDLIGDSEISDELEFTTENYQIVFILRQQDPKTRILKELEFNYDMGSIEYYEIGHEKDHIGSVNESDLSRFIEKTFRQ